MSRWSSSTDAVLAREHEVVRERLLVVEEVVLDDVGLVAQAEDELLVPEVRVVAHHVPQDGPVPDRDHRLGQELRVVPQAQSLAAAEQNDLHDANPDLVWSRTWRVLPTDSRPRHPRRPCHTVRAGTGTGVARARSVVVPSAPGGTIPRGTGGVAAPGPRSRETRSFGARAGCPGGTRMPLEVDELMRVLVTGSEGYIGTVLCAYLLDRGHDVTGLDTGFHRVGWLYHGVDRSPAWMAKDIRHVDGRGSPRLRRDRPPRRAVERSRRCS